MSRTGRSSSSKPVPIRAIPPEGLSIEAPGTYVLERDIVWQGHPSATSAIAIISEHVVLDLNGHTLSAAPDSDLAQATGITACFADGLVVRHGVVSGFQHGAVALGASTSVEIRDVVLRDTGNAVPGSAPSGLQASFCNSLKLSKLTVEGVHGSGLGAGGIVAGITLMGCNGVRIRAAIRDIYGGDTTVVAGILGLGCSDVCVQGSVGAISGSSAFVMAISFMISEGVVLDRCEISAVHNDSGMCAGLSTIGCSHLQVRRSTIRRLSTGQAPNRSTPGHTCAGMLLSCNIVTSGVTGIEVANPGSGYSWLSPPLVRIEPPSGSTGRPAAAVAVVHPSGEIARIFVLDGGSGHATPPTVTAAPRITPGGDPATPNQAPAGSGATLTAMIASSATPADVALVVTSDLLVEDCEISDIEGSCDDAHGISFYVVSSVTARRVKVRRVSSGRGGRCAKATGIEVYGPRKGAADVLIESCDVRDISAISPGNLQATGFSVAGTDVRFLRCRAARVSVRGAVPVPPHTLPGKGIGFAWAPDFRTLMVYPAVQVRIEGCTASRCQIGFDTFNFQDSLWERIRSLDNEAAIRNEPAGIVRTFYADQCSECPDAPQRTPDDWFAEFPITNVASANRFKEP